MGMELGMAGTGILIGDDISFHSRLEDFDWEAPSGSPRTLQLGPGTGAIIHTGRLRHRLTAVQRLAIFNLMSTA